MTIASEITRLQNDKAAMCTAIENKWVTVGNVTFDDYAACIDAIQTWWWLMGFCYLVVWGWWSWSSRNTGAWGWGWWEALCGRDFMETDAIKIKIWNWWASVNATNQDWLAGSCSYICFWDTNIVARWWKWGSFNGGASGNCNAWWACSSCTITAWGWWWWTAWVGWNWSWSWTAAHGWNGWLWITYCGMDFGWGWWWATCNTNANCRWLWCCGWWDWAANASWYQTGKDATWCWWWGWAGYTWWYASWKWGWGAVIISYPTDWSWGICCELAPKSTKFVCWDYTSLCFTENSTFVANPRWVYAVDYLLVWWWTGGNGRASCRIWWWGWGWGQVLVWQSILSAWDYCISIWCGGAGAVSTANCVLGCPWWDTCFNWVVAHWWTTTLCVRSTRWNDSWSWCKWWCSNNYWWGGWWGAWWAWCQNGSTWTYWAQWWNWICWYGWWGWWGAWCSSSSPWSWTDWGGTGWYGSVAWCPWQNCGWWWGWASCASWSVAWDWACWVADICYACDWSRWIHCATWGDCCYLCWDICVHRFTSDWTFTIVS